MKKVVVIGGGFAGSKIAKSLEKDFEVTLIDTKDYFEYTPAVLRAIVQPEYIRKIQVMHTHYLKRAAVITGAAKSISESDVSVKKEKIKFDYLVIASGSKYSFPFKEHEALIAHRASSLRNHYEQLHEAQKILIIGGGLSGIELAGEIIDKYPKKEITIVHAADRLMERQKESASKYVQKYLEKKGIKVIFNELIQGCVKNEYSTNKGTKIQTDLAFLCVGITPCSSFMKPNFASLVNERGFIAVNEFLQMKDRSNIFVAGDVTDIKEEKTAQLSEKHADVVVENIKRLEAGKPLIQYKHKDIAMLMSLGKRNGVLTYKNFFMKGKIPRMIKNYVQARDIRETA